MNSIVGKVLLWAGFLSGALATVSSTGNYARMGVDVTSEKDSNKVFVKHVKEDATAWSGGLRAGDLLVSMEGTEIKSKAGFGKLVGGFESKEPAEVVYLRKGKKSTANIEVLNSWATINWTWYLVSAAICFGGVCLLRMASKSTDSTGEKSVSNLKQIKASLAAAIVNAKELNNSVAKFKPRQTLEFIEEKLLSDLSDFAEGRDSITAEYGLEVFANVMTQFAAGERAINRAWSASADGYVEEAETCVQHGLNMLNSAQKLLDSAGTA